MNEQKEGRLFESEPNPSHEAFRGFIKRQHEEFLMAGSLSRIEPDHFFSTVKSRTESEEEVTREFYRNIGDELVPTFRLAQSLTITRNVDQSTCSFKMEAYPRDRRSKQDFFVELDYYNNHLLTMSYDDREGDEELGVKYTPHRISLIQILDDEQNEYEYEDIEKIQDYIVLTDEILRSRQPSMEYIRSDKYVFLANSTKDELHVLRTISEGRSDHIIVPLFINGERIVYELGLDNFLGDLDRAYNQPADSDRWQQDSYRDFLDIEWTQH